MGVREVEEKVDLDRILEQEIGQFGLFQRRTLALAAFGVVFAAFHAEYVFTAARISTRCLIPECEDASNAEFAPWWLAHAVPASGDSFDECRRFGNVTSTSPAVDDDCPAALFDAGVLQPCEHYVYENTNTVVYDFELGCDEWRRSLIGFLRTCGTPLALPLTGYASDRWGRRAALAVSALSTAVLGLLRIWTTTYQGFVISQIAEAIFGSGFYSCTYILVLELVGPDYRVVAGGAMSSFFAAGQALMGLLAWAVPRWRTLTLVLYVPQLLTVAYFWVLPESVRWYISKGRYADSETLLKEVARVNNKQLSDKSLHLLRVTSEEEKRNKASEKVEKASELWLVLLVLRYKSILVRCLVLPICWMTMTLVYHGLSINAVHMTGNPYLNFVVVSLVEVPGYWISVVLISRVGRKPVLRTCYWICAACMTAYGFLPEGMYSASLALYLVGKCAISAVVTALYVYTAECFPTRYRHNLFAFCSAVGRIGSMTAPLTPAIAAAAFPELPFLLFGVLALVSGAALGFTPETRGTALPDTMDQAERIAHHD